jgi:TolB-like protein
MKTEPQKPSTAISSQEQSSTSGGSTSGRSTPEVNSLARDERLSTRRRELRGDLDNIVLMALRKEPERRYPSVEKFAADIRGHLDGLPITARKDTLVHRSSKFLERARPAAILTLVVALLVGGSYPTFLSIRAAYTATSTGRHKTRESIAVLPFANGVDPTTERISDEITDVLIDSLSRVPRLAVPAQDSVSRFKGQTVNPKSIGRELGVATVLTGSIMFDGENFVVDAELFDTSNGQKIWSKQYSGKTLKIQFICEDMSKQLSLAMSNP